MMSHAGRSPFRLSIRSLMSVVALSAILLVPLVWFIRQQELLVGAQARAQREAARARAMGAQAQSEAKRAMYAASLLAANRPLSGDDARSSTAGNGADGTSHSSGLWAALRVNHALLSQAEAKDLDLEFSLVNDGAAVIDPKLAESRIVINGKALKESGLILGNGPGDARASALAPGDHLRFAYALGDYFKEPGTYRVSWQGAQFQSPDVVFRVLNDEKRPVEDSARP